MGTPLALDRVTSLVLDPGASVVVRGLVTTSIDGSSFDAITQTDALAPGAVRADGLFDLAAGGLRLVLQHPERHEYELAATGTVGPGCAAVGAASPCLVPRLAVLAHERLRTATELAQTLSGGVEVEGVVAPPVPPLTPQTASALGVLGVVAVIGAAAWAFVALLRRRARTALGRIHAAARAAIRATRRDPSLDRVRAQVRAMVERAVQLDRARVACADRLARIDRPSIERRREAAARAGSAEAAEVLRWITEEQAEAHRLECDLSSSVLGLERIESALRVVTLRAREHRGTPARARRADPVDAAALELALRDEALRELGEVGDVGDVGDVGELEPAGAPRGAGP
jgi:hypothetical protein